MGKIFLRTSQCVVAYNKAKDAKLGKMEDADKFSLLRIMRVLKPVVKAFDDFVTDARERLKPERFEEYVRKSEIFDSLSAEEKYEMNVALNKYNASVEACVKPEFDRELELEYEPMTEEAFGRFISSNDFDLNTIMDIEEVFVA